MSEVFVPSHPSSIRREMSNAECLAALRNQTLGRIALSVDALPAIYPVTYAYDGGSIVIRTTAGSLLDRHCRNTVVAFEIDDHDPVASTGWSVLTVGVASVVYAGEWLRALELGLASIGAPDGTVFVKIVPGTITGRTIEHVSQDEEH